MQQPDPFLHADQAQPTILAQCMDVEPRPVIVDGEFQFVIGPRWPIDGDGEFPSPACFKSVSEEPLASPGKVKLATLEEAREIRVCCRTST